MVNALDSSAVDREFEPPRLGQTKDFNIGICCFPANRAALRRNNKDLLARNLGKCIRVDETCLPAICCFSEIV